MSGTFRVWEYHMQMVQKMGDRVGAHSAGPSPVLCVFTTFPPVWWLGFSRSMHKYVDQNPTSLKKHKMYFSERVYSKSVFRKNVILNAKETLLLGDYPIYMTE